MLSSKKCVAPLQENDKCKDSEDCGAGLECKLFVKKWAFDQHLCSKIEGYEGADLANAPLSDEARESGQCQSDSDCEKDKFCNINTSPGTCESPKETGEMCMRNEECLDTQVCLHRKLFLLTLHFPFCHCGFACPLMIC